MPNTSPGFSVQLRRDEGKTLALSSLLEMTRPYLPTFLEGGGAPPKRKQKEPHWDVGAPGMDDIH